MMTMKMTNIKKIVTLFFIIDFALIIFSLFRGENWLINSQIAFLSSLFVTIASYLSYKRLIEKRVALNAESYDDRDEVDKIEDPHDLYSPEIKEEDSQKDLKEVIKEERAKIGGVKNTASNLAQSAGGIFSPFRIASYLFLFLGFLYLANNGLLNIFAYLVGLFVVPLSSMFGLVFKNE